MKVAVIGRGNVGGGLAAVTLVTMPPSPSRTEPRIATRYEKRAVNYRAAVVIAALMIWLAS